MKINKHSNKSTKKYLLVLFLITLIIGATVIYYCNWRTFNQTQPSSNQQSTDVNIKEEEPAKTKYQTQEENKSNIIEDKTPIQYEGQSRTDKPIDDNRRFKIPEDEL